MKNIIRKANARSVVGTTVLITLVFAAINTAIKILMLRNELYAGTEEYNTARGGYLLMLMQCLLGVVVIALPRLIERKLSIKLPNYLCILYFAFLFCAIYLGEVRNFYYRVSFWDITLHAMSAMMLAAFGFSLVSMLNDTAEVEVSLNPFFVALFAFCFALACGAIWEIYEFAFDGMLGLNMQKFALKDGTEMVGRAALGDTMEDIIVDAISALVVSVIGYVFLRRRVKNKSVSSEE